MIKWAYLLIFVATSFLVAEDPEKTETLTYQCKTIFSSKASDLFSFSWEQTLDFECEFSPNLLDEFTLTFKRIRGKGLNRDVSLQIDTQDVDDTHYDLICLQRIVDKPLKIQLNRDFSIKHPVEDHSHLLELNPQTENFFSAALLNQLTAALLSPLRYDSENNILLTSLYYPFQSHLTISPNLSFRKEGPEIFFDQELKITGAYQFNEETFSIDLVGDLSGEVQWDQGINFSKYFHISHLLDEKAVDPLFSSPLQFEYSFNLQQMHCD